MKVTTKLGRMSIRYDYTTVCDDIKRCKDNPNKVELTNPVDYTKEELASKYDLNATVIKWQDTYTEAGEPTMAVVLEKKSLL